MRTSLKIAGIFLLVALLAATAQCAENTTEEARIMAPEGIKTVQVGDINMACKVMGQGEPLVLVIGASATMDAWPHEFLDKLASKYQVIVFDNRGMGYTTASPANFSVSQFANDTAGLMDALGIKQANILGISLGGFIAQELAIERPDKVKRLVLIATYCGGAQAIQADPAVMRKIPDLTDSANLTVENLERFIEVMFPHKWLVSHPDYYNQFIHSNDNRSNQTAETSSPENLKRQTAAVYQWPGTYDRLDRIMAPTLIITGMDDLIIPPENSLILANRINGSWLIRLENSGHGLFGEYPSELARIVAEFIEMSATDPFAQPFNASS